MRNLTLNTLWSETMDVYSLYDDCTGDYRVLNMVGGSLFDFVRRFDGTPMKRPWTDVTLAWDPDSRSPKGDFNSLMLCLPTFSPRAIDALGDLLEGHGEILPTSCKGERVYFFNVTRVIDALDESNSELRHYLGSHKISTIKRYAFFMERLTGVTIFKIPHFSKVFVTGPFVERVNSAGLTGFWFPRRWSTDKRAIIDNVA